MTGIPSSRGASLMWRVFACGVGLPIATADDIALTGKDHLSGIVRSINDAGIVELSTPLSPGPVFLKAGSVRKVQFSQPKDNPENPGAMVELVNGDLLPVSIAGLDEQYLTVVTLDAGKLEIPRTSLKSLQLGISKRKVVYSGPKNLDEWFGDNEAGRNWKFQNNALVADGPAYASKKFEIPRQFVLHFKLKWQGRPNLQIFFADPLKPRGEASDRYSMQFSGAGLELKRESSKATRSITVALLSNRTPDLYPDNQLEVELRVDRKASRFHILLNGEQEAAGFDPIPDPPTGGGMTIVSHSSNGNEQEISSLEILEFDDARARHQSENRGDPKKGSLISRDDDRWGGQLSGIRNSADGLVYYFKNEFQDQPLELLESDVSTVFFADSTGPSASKAYPTHPFVLKLQENGLLHVTSCSFTETAVSAIHPLIGPLTIRRDGVVAMERLNPNLKDAPQK